MDECTKQRSVNRYWFLSCLGRQNENMSAQGLGPMAEQILMNLGNTGFANHHLSIQHVDRQQKHKSCKPIHCRATRFARKYESLSSRALASMQCDECILTVHALLSEVGQTLLREIRRSISNSRLCHRALVTQGLDMCAKDKGKVSSYQWVLSFSRSWKHLIFMIHLLD